ncbi:hypothetical protein G7054_g120 [Neopestalotiopsis clavispora]|nr:hypothetical protein G7054_g120 [Neopestalotiopsis clavispora]
MNGDAVVNVTATVLVAAAPLAPLAPGSTDATTHLATAALAAVVALVTVDDVSPAAVGFANNTYASLVSPLLLAVAAASAVKVAAMG